VITSVHNQKCFIDGHCLRGAIDKKENKGLNDCKTISLEKWKSGKVSNSKKN